MVQTITPVVHGGRRSRWAVAVAFHTLGAGLSAAAFGAALGAGGSLLGAPWGRTGALLIGCIALLYAAREVLGIPISIPDRRRQVPEWWRWSFSPNTAAFLYGLGLGIGFLTYVRYGTLVAVSTVAIVTGHPLAGAVVLAPFGIARGLSIGLVWWGTSQHRVERVIGRLESLAVRPFPKVGNAAVLFLLGVMALLVPLVEEAAAAAAVASWFLGLLFGWASAAKLTQFREWRATLDGYALPRLVEALARPLVPVAEAGVLALAFWGMTRQSAVLATTLLVLFSATVVWARRKHGRRMPCGCFGKRKEWDYRTLLLRNLALSIVAAASFLGDPGRLVLEGARPPRAGEWVPTLLVAGGLGLGALVLRQLQRLRTNQPDRSGVLP